jgi:hypothetical protein
MFEERKAGRQASFDRTSTTPETPPPPVVAPAVGPTEPTTEAIPQARLEADVANKVLNEPAARAEGHPNVVVGGALITMGTDSVHVDFGAAEPDAVRLKQWSTELIQGDRKVLVMVVDSREVADMAGTTPEVAKPALEAVEKEELDDTEPPGGDSPA